MTGGTAGTFACPPLAPRLIIGSHPRPPRLCNYTLVYQALGEIKRRVREGRRGFRRRLLVTPTSSGVLARSAMTFLLFSSLRIVITLQLSVVIFSDPPSPAATSSRDEAARPSSAQAGNGFAQAGTGFAQTGNHFTLFGIVP
jgi:hypothetical protein